MVENWNAIRAMQEYAQKLRRLREKNDTVNLPIDLIDQLSPDQIKEVWRHFVGPTYKLYNRKETG